MPQDLMPLFLFKEKGEEELKQAGAIITANGEAYKASSFISNIAEAIEDEVEAVMNGDEMGELTVAAYILLESLHRAGMAKVASNLLSEPTSIFHSALCCAIGMRAGMMIPEGAQFETTANDSDLSIREITEGESKDPD